MLREGGCCFNPPIAALDVGAPTELGAVGAELYETRKRIIRTVIRHLATIINPIGAPKMDRASIFLHAASGFLKKYSLEAEESHF